MKIKISENQLRLLENKNLISENLFSKIFNKKPLNVKREFLNITSNIWVHSSFNLENEIKTGKLIMSKENLNDFVYDPNEQIKGKFSLQTNINAPYFSKGFIFSGYDRTKYILSCQLKDDAFVPNRNGCNYTSFGSNGSGNVGVLKPEYRALNNFQFWARDDNWEQKGDNNYYKIEI